MSEQDDRDFIACTQRRSEVGTIDCPFKLVVIGGGPAGCSLIVRAARIGVLDDLCDFSYPAEGSLYKSGYTKPPTPKKPHKFTAAGMQFCDDSDYSIAAAPVLGGVCIIEADGCDRFGGGKLQDYQINSNTFADKFVTNVVEEKTENIIPKESVRGYPELQSLVAIPAAADDLVTSAVASTSTARISGSTGGNTINRELEGKGRSKGSDAMAKIMVKGEETYISLSSNLDESARAVSSSLSADSSRTTPPADADADAELERDLGLYPDALSSNNSPNNQGMIIDKEKDAGKSIEVVRSSAGEALLYKYGATEAPLSTVGAFLRDVGCSISTIVRRKYPESSRILTSTRVIALHRVVIPPSESAGASTSVAAATAASASAASTVPRSSSSDKAGTASSPSRPSPSSSSSSYSTRRASTGSSSGNGCGSKVKTKGKSTFAEEAVTSHLFWRIEIDEPDFEHLFPAACSVASLVESSNSVLDIHDNAPGGDTQQQQQQHQQRQQQRALSGRKKRCIFAKNVVFSSGGTQDMPLLKNERHMAKVVLSDDVCTEKGMQRVRALLSLANTSPAFPAHPSPHNLREGASSATPAASTYVEMDESNTSPLSPQECAKNKNSLPRASIPVSTTGAKVVIVGGSHSAFSAAWMCMNKLAAAPTPKAASPTLTPSSSPSSPSSFLTPLGPGSIVLLHRSSIKVFYSCKAEADSDGYGAADEQGASVVNRVTGHYHTFGGIRGDAKALWREISAGREPRVRMLRINNAIAPVPLSPSSSRVGSPHNGSLCVSDLDPRISVSRRKSAFTPVTAPMRSPKASPRSIKAASWASSSPEAAAALIAQQASDASAADVEKLFDDAAVIVWACGYSSYTVPVYDLNGALIPLKYVGRSGGDGKGQVDVDERGCVLAQDTYTFADVAPAAVPSLTTASPAGTATAATSGGGNGSGSGCSSKPAVRRKSGTVSFSAEKSSSSNHNNTNNSCSNSYNGKNSVLKSAKTYSSSANSASLSKKFGSINGSSSGQFGAVNDAAGLQVSCGFVPIRGDSPRAALRSDASKATVPANRLAPSLSSSAWKRAAVGTAGGSGGAGGAGAGRAAVSKLMQKAASLSSVRNSRGGPSVDASFPVVPALVPLPLPAKDVLIGRPIPGLFGSGMGFGQRAILEDGQPDGSSGRADGVAVYLKKGASLVLAGVLGSEKVFGGKGIHSWEERTEALRHLKIDSQSQSPKKQRAGAPTSSPSAAGRSASRTRAATVRNNNTTNDKNNTNNTNNNNTTSMSSGSSLSRPATVPASRATGAAVGASVGGLGAGGRDQQGSATTASVGDKPHAYTISPLRRPRTAPSSARSDGSPSTSSATSSASCSSRTSTAYRGSAPGGGSSAANGSMCLVMRRGIRGGSAGVGASCPSGAGTGVDPSSSSSSSTPCSVLRSSVPGGSSNTTVVRGGGNAGFGGSSNSANPVLANKLFYPYSQLIFPGPYPKGVNISRREVYLSDTEFEEVMGVSKEGYVRMPMWKRNIKKKEMRLF